MSGSSNHHTNDAHSPMDRGLASPTSERVLQCVLGSVLFERFCFFLLISVLVLYLNERRGYSAPHAVQLYSMFVSGCYLMPLIGGQLCDGRLGSGRTSLLGMAIQSVGFVLFAVLDSDFTAILLALIAFGAGLFKAGTQTLVGGLFSSADPKRDRAFGTVYVVVNVAALVAPILGGIVQTWECYRVLFALLVVSSVLGCVCLLPASLSASRPLLPLSTEVSATNSESSARAKLALVLSAGAVFAAAFVQSHSTLLLFVRDHTDRHVGTVQIPVAWFAAAPGALVLLAAPVLSVLFTALRNRNREPSTLHKMAIGMLITALACLPMAGAVYAARGGRLVSSLWVLSCMAMLAVGEILVGALAPSEISRIAPPHRTGRWLSYWFLATAIGNALGGWVEW